MVRSFVIAADRTRDLKDRVGRNGVGAAILLTACALLASPLVSSTVASSSGRCLLVAPKIVAAISEGLTVKGRLRGVRAVRSRDFSRAYFVSADIQAAGMLGRDEIATWTTNRIGDYGSVFAVSGFAREFSDWGSGGANFSMSNDGAAASRSCTRTALR